MRLPKDWEVTVRQIIDNQQPNEANPEKERKEMHGLLWLMR